MRFFYEELYQQPIRRMELAGNLGTGQIDLWKMTQKEGNWVLETDLPPGRYYYKFLADREQYLQDPGADSYLLDQRGEYWSVIQIGENGEPVFADREPVTVYEYHICESLEAIPLVDKREYLSGRNKRVAVRLLTEAVQEIHPVQAVWFRPDGTLCQVTTGSLPSGEEGQAIYSWFWLPLEAETMPGRWRILLYIDGILCQEDSFLLRDTGMLPGIYHR